MRITRVEGSVSPRISLQGHCIPFIPPPEAQGTATEQCLAPWDVADPENAPEISNELISPAAALHIEQNTFSTLWTWTKEDIKEAWPHKPIQLSHPHRHLTERKYLSPLLHHESLYSSVLA